jgi:hypothetical protein
MSVRGRMRGCCVGYELKETFLVCVGEEGEAV